MSQPSRGGSVDSINGFTLPKSCKMESRPSFKDKAIKGSYEFDEVEFFNDFEVAGSFYCKKLL